MRVARVDACEGGVQFRVEVLARRQQVVIEFLQDPRGDQASELVARYDGQVIAGAAQTTAGSM